MLFVIGTILELIVLIMSAFSPVLYTQSWEYGKITGIGKVYNQGNKVSYDLFSIMGVWYILVIVAVAINAILFLVFYLKKMSHQIPGFVLSLIYALPLVFIFIGRTILGNEAKFIGGATAVYGTGSNSGFTCIGWVVFILMIIAIILTVAGIISQRTQLELNPENKVKTIKKVESKSESVKEEDFKM